MFGADHASRQRWAAASWQGCGCREIRKYARLERLPYPNGPLLNGGSDGDNGQTGRKLVMDYYGPRVPLGGGALSGKHLTHIDRIGAYAARDAAVRAVRSGAASCRVQLTYAPNLALPLDVTYRMDGAGERQPAQWFDHADMAARYPPETLTAGLGCGRHFADRALPWNGHATPRRPMSLDSSRRNRPMAEK